MKIAFFRPKSGPKDRSVWQNETCFLFCTVQPSTDCRVGHNARGHFSVACAFVKQQSAALSGKKGSPNRAGTASDNASFQGNTSCGLLLLLVLRLDCSVF